MTTLRTTAHSVSASWLWLSTALLATSETALNYHARPGINWALSCVMAVAAVLIARRVSGSALPARAVLYAALACVLGAGGAITASPLLDAVIVLGTAGLLAASLLTVQSPGSTAPWGILRLPFMPLQALGVVLAETARRGAVAVGHARADSTLPALRGIALAAPITLVFALLLSAADPTLAAWREALIAALRNLTFVGQGLCLVSFAVLSLGSLGVALAPALPPPVATARAAAPRGLGEIERLPVLAAVVALFALFFLLQLSHLLGAEAAVRGSGVTYAQAAHQGFAELTLAASLCVALLLALTRAAPDGLRVLERRLGVVLIVQAQLLLLSAFHRITVYEDAYGYTALRLFVQCYALVVLVALALFAIEIATRPDFARLAQRWVVTVAIALIGMIYWNHSAWVVRQNLQRFERTAQLDIRYLVRGLGPDAVPAQADALRRLPAELAQRWRACLQATYGRHLAALERPAAWYEWSYRHERLLIALHDAGVRRAEDVAQDPVAATCSDPR